jgi:hypothetical protein
MHPPQRPRPVGPGAQLCGELVEELAHPASHDVVGRDRIDARGSAVGTDLTPSPPQHVAAGDLVIQGMKAAILILLSAAVEHALESTNRSTPLARLTDLADTALVRVPLILPVHR